MARKNPVGANRMTKSDFPYEATGDSAMDATLMGESRRRAVVGRMTGNDPFGDSGKSVQHNMFGDIIKEIKRRFGKK